VRTARPRAYRPRAPRTLILPPARRLGGTLKAAKKRGIVAYDAPLLLKGAHDKIAIVLLVEPAAA
jgi:hypothetical protein